MRHSTPFFTVLVLLLCASANAQTLVSQFNFYNNHFDDLGNATCTPFVADTSYFENDVYHYEALNNDTCGGLVVTVPVGLMSPEHFSIGLDFQLSEVTGYNKIVDFKSRQSDLGVYVNFTLDIYSGGNDGQINFVADSMHRVLIVRDSTIDSLITYLWTGTELKKEAHNADVNNSYSVDTVDGNLVFHFFMDDVTQSEYSEKVGVDKISLWDGIASVDQFLGIEEREISPWSKIYPNPANDEIRLEFNSPQSGEVKLYDTAGQLKKSQRLNQMSAVSLDLSTLSPGMYIVCLNDHKTKIIVK